MTPFDVHEKHQDAVNRLHELREQRQKLAQRFRGLRIDTPEAHNVWTKVWELTAAISAALEEVNGYAEQAGKPIMQ